MNLCTERQGPSVGDLTDERTAGYTDVGPLDRDDVIARLSDVIDDVVDVVPGVGDVGLADGVGAGARDAHRQRPVTRLGRANLRREGEGGIST